MKQGPRGARSLLGMNGELVSIIGGWPHTNQVKAKLLRELAESNPSPSEYERRKAEILGEA